MRFLLLSTVMSLSALTFSPVSASFSQEDIDMQKAISNSLATAKQETNFREDIARAKQLSRNADIKAKAIESRNMQTTLLNSFATAREEAKFQNDIQKATANSFVTAKRESAVRSTNTAPTLAALQRHVSHFSAPRASSKLVAPQTIEQEQNDIKLATVRSLSTLREHEKKDIKLAITTKDVAPTVSKSVLAKAFPLKSSAQAVKDQSIAIKKSNKSAALVAKKIANAKIANAKIANAKIANAKIANAKIAAKKRFNAMQAAQKANAEVNRTLHPATTNKYKKPAQKVFSGNVREKIGEFNKTFAPAIQVN